MTRSRSSTVAAAAVPCSQMLLKEVIQHFKAFTSSKEERTAFIKLVSRVATLVADEGGGKVAKLKEATLAEYNLLP